MKQTKKGFTLVELLVVIAILAILTTVSVVGYTSFIEKANRSVDEQAVAQMNMALLAADIPAGSITGIAQVQELLDECNLEIEDYKPLSKERFFFYDSSLNRIVYTDNNYNVLYPQELADDINKESWFSLCGEINTVTIDSTWLDNQDATVTVKISTAEQLYTLSKNFEKYAQKDVDIKLQGNINMMGASIVFNNNIGGNVNFTMTAENPVTISNIGQGKVSARMQSSTDNEFKNFGGGLVANSNATGVITFKNITIKNSVFGNDEVTSVGAFVGRAQAASKIVLDNCHVEGTTVSAWYRAGGFVGLSEGGSTIVEFKNGCSIKNSTIITEAGLTAQLIGTAEPAANQVVGATAVDVENNTLKLNGENRKPEYPAHSTDALYHIKDGDAYSTVK